MLKLFKQYYPIRNLIFILGEFILIFFCVLISSWILLDEDVFFSDRWIMLKALLIAVTCQTFIYYNDLYDMRISNSYAELGIRLMQALGFSSFFLAGVYYLIPQVIIGEGIFAITVGLTLLLIVLWRFGYTILLNRGVFNEKIVLLGSGQLACDIMKEIREKKDCGYTIYLTVTERDDNSDFLDYHTVSELLKSYCDSLCDIVENLKIKKIVVAIKQQRGAFPAKELLKCRVNGTNIIMGNSFYEMLTGKLTIEQINPAWLIFSKGFRKSKRARFFKRAVDLVLTIFLFILLLPIIVITAILIKLDSKGPVIFSQERVGEKRKEYKVHKFRSMAADAEKLSGPVWASDDDPRITRVGRIIRKLRIDEIPQIWNVLKGEMSFVGPRPEREFFVKELEEQIPYYGERFTVKPGITGWAQVSYGYGASVEDSIEKLKYDLFYTKNFSLLMDIMIILRTIKTVIFGRGAR